MKPDSRVTLSIGINETQPVFRSRLQTMYHGYMSPQELDEEAFVQALGRDIHMAKSVNDLKNPLLRLLDKL